MAKTNPERIILEPVKNGIIMTTEYGWNGEKYEVSKEVIAGDEAMMVADAFGMTIESPKMLSNGFNPEIFEEDIKRYNEIKNGE